MADQYTSDLFPQVARIELPAQALRLPLDADEPPDAPQPATLHTLCEQLTPLISNAIARMARQRRYAPR